MFRFRIQLFSFVAIAASFVACDGRAAAEKLTLARGGKAKAVIVLPAKATSAGEETAEILADHLKQICGAEFSVIRESDIKAAKVEDQRIVVGEATTDQVYVLLGECKLTKSLGAKSDDLGPGGILIRTFPNALVILGAVNSPSDPNGTRYAVTTFLEDALGCRCLWPGELGKVVPKSDSIKISPIDHSFTPVLKQRRIRMAGGYGDRKDKGVQRLGFEEADYHRINTAAVKTSSRDGGWASWHRLGGSLRLASGHSFGYMWEAHKDEHPEWFAVQPDGSRDQSRSPDRSRLCVSNIELIEEIARDRIERLNSMDAKSVSIGPNDGGQTSFCRCEECRKLDPPNSRKLPGGGVALTDRYVYFWNEIAKRVTKVHPDATLTVDAYSVYSAPPVLRKLHPSLAVRVVGLTYTDEEKRQQALADWKAWSTSVERVYVRPNVLLAGRRQGTPVIYVHKMADDFRFMVKHSLVGTDFDSCCHNWATQGLNYYICAKLHWNPDLDVDEVIEDYCRTGFGEGAESVKKYFATIEAITNKMATSDLKYTEPLTPAVINELRGYLDTAASATKGDTHRRVEFLLAGLDYTEAYVAAFRIIREHEANNPGGGRLSEETKRQIRKALDNNWLVSRDIFENNHLAVNVATVAWGSWNYFARYYWSEPSPDVRERAMNQ